MSDNKTDGTVCFPSPDPRDYESPADYGTVVIDGERVPESSDWPRFMRERTMIVGTRSLQTDTERSDNEV